MQDRTLYARLLGIEDPWRVTDVTLRLDEEQAVVVSVEMDSGATLHCPKCQSPGSRYDCREHPIERADSLGERTFISRIRREASGGDAAVSTSPRTQNESDRIDLENSVHDCNRIRIRSASSQPLDNEAGKGTLFGLGSSHTAVELGCPRPFVAEDRVSACRKFKLRFPHRR
jgi:hypothetical protein